MGEKDIAEKVLEDYNDVFADIVNVLLFQGEQIVKPEQLEDKTLLTSIQYQFYIVIVNIYVTLYKKYT